MVNEQSRAGDGQIERGQSQLEFTFVVPYCAADQVNNFDGEFRSIFTGTSFVERQKKAAIRRLPWAHRFACQGCAPECGARRQSDFEEIALVVANCVTRLNECFAFAADEDLIASFG